jgi:hypothetical protein
MEMSYLLLIHNAAQVVQVCSKKEQFKTGHEMNDVDYKSHGLTLDLNP